MIFFFLLSAPFFSPGLMFTSTHEIECCGTISNDPEKAISVVYDINSDQNFFQCKAYFVACLYCITHNGRCWH